MGILKRCKSQEVLYPSHKLVKGRHHNCDKQNNVMPIAIPIKRTQGDSIKKDKIYVVEF